ncbi:hypothetical protein ARTSIC4J27_81 [Pseudarthrobacter siccitolerans]|uniref:Uncharacterized protein n=1 Tax=Pseudarthrobacter siccitolerans TaxID=861266 RepID=A0A024GWN3_9MICC|nr:hypothetical protein ARTSIC4J27_81 [Pseudarthrobacter siccitolerans]
MDFPDFNPPFAEPVDDNLEDPHDFSPDDPIWDDFYAHPRNCPKTRSRSGTAGSADPPQSPVASR